jgi:hypothetical protein
MKLRCEWDLRSSRMWRSVDGWVFPDTQFQRQWLSLENNIALSKGRGTLSPQRGTCRRSLLIVPSSLPHHTVQFTERAVFTAASHSAVYWTRRVHCRITQCSLLNVTCSLPHHTVQFVKRAVFTAASHTAICWKCRVNCRITQCSLLKVKCSLPHHRVQFAEGSVFIAASVQFAESAASVFMVEG